MYAVMSPPKALFIIRVHVHFRSNWNLEMLVFEERGKPEYPEKNLSEQGRKPTTRGLLFSNKIGPGGSHSALPFGNIHWHQEIIRLSLIISCWHAISCRNTQNIWMLEKKENNNNNIGVNTKWINLIISAHLSHSAQTVLRGNSPIL